MAVSEAENQTSLKETFQDAFTVVARRRWWVLCTSCGIALATLLVVRQFPDRYVSEAILARHQLISQGYTLGTTMMLTNEEALEEIKREVLSRPRLLAIVNQFDLYANARKKGASPQRLVQVMRKDITIEPLDPVKLQGESSAFKVSFIADDPKTAQRVVDELVHIFIETNTKAREDKAEETTTFLKEEVDSARANLSHQEQRVQDFKAQHGNDLPDQQIVNLSSATELRNQLQTTQNSVDRLNQQHESLLTSLSSDLARRQLNRSALLARYTPRHPEVLKKEQEILAIGAALKRLKSGSSTGGNIQNLPAPEDPMLADLLKQADLNGRELESTTREATRLRAGVGQFQTRLNSAPLREQQLAALMRDYDLFKQEYTSLLNKQLQSAHASNLEERGGGVQFRLVDPPTLPLAPSSPPRIPICLGGAAGGLLVGLGLAFVSHLFDGTLGSEKSVKRRFALPIVVGVPTMLTPAEDRQKMWRRRVEWLVASAMTLAVVGAEVFVLRQG